MMIWVNGQQEQIGDGVSVAEYVARKRYRTDRIAVELNGAILPKASYGDTLLRPGDRMEIVNFVGGG